MKESAKTRKMTGCWKNYAILKIAASVILQKIASCMTNRWQYFCWLNLNHLKTDKACLKGTEGSLHIFSVHVHTSFNFNY